MFTILSKVTAFYFLDLTERKALAAMKSAPDRGLSDERMPTYVCLYTVWCVFHNSDWEQVGESFTVQFSSRDWIVEMELKAA